MPTFESTSIVNTPHIRRLHQSAHQCRGQSRGQRPIYTLNPAPYTLHPTPYTLHTTPYTLHPTPFTLHPSPFTLHPTPHRKMFASKYAPHSQVAAERATMQEAVSGARTLLAFSSEMQTAFLRALTVSGPTDIMPQVTGLS